MTKSQKSKVKSQKFFIGKIIMFGLFVGLFIFSFFHFVSAENLADALSKVNSTVAPKTGIEQRDVSVVIARTIKAIFAVSGMIFFGLMIYSGFNWMIARGKEDKIEKSKNTIIAATIGFVIIISSYAITNLVQTRIIEGKLSNSDMNQNSEEESKIGCCVDWVSGTDVAGGNWARLTSKASRITTFKDCKTWGEKEGSGDVWYCDGPKEGCWMFTEGITDMDVCNQIRDNY